MNREMIGVDKVWQAWTKFSFCSEFFLGRFPTYTVS